MLKQLDLFFSGMLSHRNRPFYKNTWLWLMLFSVVISVVRFSFYQPINPDGVIYLTAAKVFMTQGLQASMQIYPWPFYPILIGFIAKVTHLSVLTSAYLLSVLLDSLTVVAFIFCAQLLNTKINLFFLSGCIILFFPYFAHFRDLIVRDHGYYSFALFGFYYLCRYSKEQYFYQAVLWGVSILIAGLFRIEGFVFAALAPVALLFASDKKGKHRFSLFMEAYWVQIICVISILVLALIAKWHGKEINTGRLIEFKQAVWNSWHPVMERLLQIGASLSKQMSPYTPVKATIWILMIGILGFIFVSVVQLISPLFAFLAVHTFYKREGNWGSGIKAIWISFLIINFTICFVFFLQNLFIDERYYAFFAIILLLLIPQNIPTTYAFWKKHRDWQWRSWLFPLTFILLIVWVFASLTFIAPSKYYYIAAGRWAETAVPKDKTILVNDPVILFYTQHAGAVDNPIPCNIDKSLQNISRTEMYDYAMFVIYKSNEQAIHKLNQFFKSIPIKTFSNARGDRIVVYQLH